MKAYKVCYPDSIEFEMTLADAHRSMKEHAKGGEDWRDITAFEVEVATNKENIINLMNGYGEVVETGRSWELTPRLGLKEQADESE